MESCCIQLHVKIETLLSDCITNMKIYKSMDLFELRESFKNLELYQGENDYLIKICNISDRAKKCFENSQKQILKEKYLLLCQNSIYEYDSEANKHFVYHEKFLEKAFEISEGKKDKIILLLYSLINNKNKEGYISELFLLAGNSSDQEKMKYLKFKSVLCEYIHKLLFCAYTALGIFYSKNPDVFEDVFNTINNTINSENINMFGEMILNNYEEYRFFKDYGAIIKKKNRKISESMEIEKSDIEKVFKENKFLHNILELINKYLKYFEYNKRLCV